MPSESIELHTRYSSVNGRRVKTDEGGSAAVSIAPEVHGNENEGFFGLQRDPRQQLTTEFAPVYSPCRSLYCVFELVLLEAQCDGLTLIFSGVGGKRIYMQEIVEWARKDREDRHNSH